MSTNEYTRPGGSGFLTGLAALVMIVVALGIGYTFLPKILATPLPTTLILPTAVIKPSGAQPAVNVEATSAAYNATEQARAVPQPNVNTTGDSASLVREQKAVEVAPASAGVVPTSEPINGNFGSKPIAPINIQATHQCLHAQIWTDTGCHNPTPVR